MDGNVPIDLHAAQEIEGGEVRRFRVDWAQKPDQQYPSLWISLVYRVEFLGWRRGTDYKKRARVSRVSLRGLRCGCVWMTTFVWPRRGALATTATSGPQNPRFQLRFRAWSGEKGNRISGTYEIYRKFNPHRPYNDHFLQRPSLSLASLCAKICGSFLRFRHPAC